MNIFGPGGHAFPEPPTLLSESDATRGNLVAFEIPGSMGSLSKAATDAQGAHVVYGMVVSKKGSDLELRTRPSALIPTGILKVDASPANKGESNQGDEVASITLTYPNVQCTFAQPRFDRGWRARR
jgi:hypothetical protein